MPKQALYKPQPSRKPVSDMSEDWQHKNTFAPNQSETTATPTSSIVQLQRTIGNQAVMRLLTNKPDAIQRKFDPPLPSNASEVYQLLLPANPTLKLWKVQQAMSSPQSFTTLEQVAAFLKINPPSGVTTEQQPTTDQKPTTTQAPKTVVPSTTTTDQQTTGKPQWMTNLRPTTRRPEPVKTTTTEQVEIPKLRSVTPPSTTTTEQPPTTETAREHKFGQVTVVVTDSMKSIVNSENITNMKQILNSSPEFINITVDGVSYRVKPSQDFLNIDKSKEYRDDSSAIRGAEVELMRPPINNNAPDDVLVITDGHHRFVWNSYHGITFQATFKKTRLASSLWRDVRYKPTPSNLKK